MAAAPAAHLPSQVRHLGVPVPGWWCHVSASPPRSVGEMQVLWCEAGLALSPKPAPPQAKPGFCPRKRARSSAATCSNRCADDRDCPGNRKCCFSGCGLACARPNTGTAAPSLPWAHGLPDLHPPPKHVHPQHCPWMPCSYPAATPVGSSSPAMPDVCPAVPPDKPQQPCPAKCAAVAAIQALGVCATGCSIWCYAAHGATHLPLAQPPTPEPPGWSITLGHCGKGLSCPAPP